MRAWRAPEVIQTSAMDCGPAVLKAALEGFGVEAHLGRLREACQTEVDGTSTRTLAALARALGLQALQTVVPVAHLGVEGVAPLPAIVVTQNPDGTRHFVLLWRAWRGWVQVMDPEKGRRWTRWSALREVLYMHTARLDDATFGAWLRSPLFLGGLAARLVALGTPEAEVEALLVPRMADADALLALEAGVRRAEALRAAGALRRGDEARRMALAFAEEPLDDDALPPARKAPEGAEVSGAVLILLGGPEGGSSARPASEALRRALETPPERPMADLWASLRALAPRAPLLALGVAGVGALGGVAQAALLRALLDGGRWLETPAQRGAAVGAMLVLAGLIAGMGWAWAAFTNRLGRHFELHLRAAFHAKLPRLSDRYFSSRLASDLAERAHAMASLRALPAQLTATLSALAGLLGTLAGLIALDPGLAPMALASAVSAVALPALLHPLLVGRELRRQTFDGSLARTYLDAMMGATPVRAHGAEEAIRREHEGLLTFWRRAGEEALLASTLAGLVQGVVGLSLAALMVQGHLERAVHGGGALLVVYWATQLPGQGRGLTQTLRALPAVQGVALRLLEPLGAPEEPPADAEDPWPPGPLSVALREVTVSAGGAPLLEVEALTVAAGEHVAIVGPSGAGKSTLLSVLLGWWTPTRGAVEVGGLALTPARLQALRRRTAWVDPTVRIWNASLLDNLRYGHEGPLDLDPILAEADLFGLLRELPGGLSEPLGEDGGLLSGGQGQRVRLGRALGARAPGLVLLDEPFRGLDRASRRRLLERARARWAGATLLLVTHDVLDVEGFSRVLVIEGGRVVEDGSPAALRAAGGRYAALAAGERALLSRLEGDAAWRRLHLEGGRLVEEGAT